MAEFTSFSEWLTQIADAIRTKKGTTDKIVPKNFADEIASIESGSGGGNVVTVSFYNYDGTFLFEKPTIAGDDCVDVVAKGLLATPTRESSNEYNYSFSGWSLTSGGSVDSSVLLNVTEERSVYAVYNESVRYYTVRFFDGETLVDTVQVTYGSTATTDYVKDGYKINDYEPSNINITQDTDIVIQFVIDDGLIHDDWDAISSYCADGSYITRYKVGDIKQLEVNYADGTSEIIPMRIVQVDSTYDVHYDDYTKTSKLVFIADNLLKNSIVSMTSQDGDWYDSALYNYLNNDLLSYLPQTLQDSIVKVSNYSETLGPSNSLYRQLKGKIWVPTSTELWNSLYSGTYAESGGKADGFGVVYDEYKNDTQKRLFTKVDSKTNEEFWFRTVNRNSNGSKFYMQYATTSRTISNDYNSSKGVLIGLCIG